MEFKVGDIVKFGGVEYELGSWRKGKDKNLPLCIRIEGVGIHTFTRDGRIDPSHNEPLLTLVRRAEPEKKWVKQLRYRPYFASLANKDREVISNFCYKTKEAAISEHGDIIVGWQSFEIEVLE